MGRLALAGWPISGDHGPVGQAAVLTLLEQSDLAPAVPRLGGMARANGVVIVSERYWAFAGRDGSLREGRMPVPPRALRSIPLARGLVRLAGSLSPLFRRQGVARRRERLFLAAAIVAPPILAFAPHTIGLLLGLVTTTALMGWLLRGRTLFLHGAEHRAIAALEERRLRATWPGAGSCGSSGRDRVPWTASIFGSIRVRSTAFSVQTAPGSRRRCTCSRRSCRRRPERLASPAMTSSRTARRSARRSARPCRRQHSIHF